MVNADSIAHTLVSDTDAIPEFLNTGPLAPGAERTSLMMTLGTTTFHCTDHPQMTGTLIVQDR
jgi:plastocyanin